MRGRLISIALLMWYFSLAVSLVPRPLFSVLVYGGGKRVWWISVGHFVLRTPRFWESLIGVDNYKDLFDEVSITIAYNYIIK